MAERDFHLRRAGVALGVLALAFVLCGSRPAATGAAQAAGSVRVAFLQGEQLAVVARPGGTPTEAVRALLAGPSSAERKRGFRTYLTTGTRLHRLGVAGSLATVDLNRAFAAGPPERRAARLAQLVRTLTGLDGVTRVQVLVDGSPRSASSRVSRSRGRSRSGCSRRRTCASRSRRSRGFRHQTALRRHFRNS